MSSTIVQRRGGTTIEHSTFIGADREITVDTVKHTAVVHDGTTPGGYPLAKESDMTELLSGKLSTAGGTLTGAITAMKETSIILAATATPSIDLSKGNLFFLNMTTSISLSIANQAPAGTVNSFILEITNNNGYTITWWNNIKWTNGLAPVLPAGTNVLGFYSRDGGTTWRGIVLSKDSK